MINRTVYARKLSGAGVGVLAILPFADAEESSDGETIPPLPPYDDDGYIIQIPRELVERGQRKFVVEF